MLSSDPFPIEKLRSWFLKNKRSFLWRKDITPYSVWVSEVMLQQTQADRVGDYFQRWLRLFPTIDVLSRSSEEKVIKAWEGLGYYSRARALRKGAQYVLENLSGALPSDYTTLTSIPGIGPYTASAIMAFGFHRKKAAVDSNVFRVLTRFFAIQDDITKIKTQEVLRDFADTLLPEEKPWEIAEAFIELGALCCTKKPSCIECPLQKDCKAYTSSRILEFPNNPKKVLYEKLYRETFIIIHGDSVLVEKGKEGKLFSGLYHFPYQECSIDGLLVDEAIILLEKEMQIKAKHIYTFSKEQHSFTRFRVTLYPKLYWVDEKQNIPTGSWHTFKELETLTFASGHRTLLNKLLCFQDKPTRLCSGRKPPICDLQSIA